MMMPCEYQAYSSPNIQLNHGGMLMRMSIAPPVASAKDAMDRCDLNTMQIVRFAAEPVKTYGSN